MPPMSIQWTLMAKKPISVSRIGAGVDRRVHNGVVQMLALNRRVIAQDHVAAMQSLAAIDGKAVAHGHADRVGDEHRHAAGALRDQLAIRADESDSEVFILVDVGTESRARDVGVDLIGDRNDAVADHFEGDGVDGMIRPSLDSTFHSCWFRIFFSTFSRMSSASDCVHETRFRHFVRR